MLFRFFRKFRILLKSEDKKTFPVAIILFRIIASLFVILLLPLIFFIIFIAKEPREITSINTYIKNEIIKQGIDYINYSSAKMSFNKHFEVVYIVQDLDFAINNVFLKLPIVNFKIKLIDLIKNKVLLNEVELNNFVGHCGYENKNNEEHKRSLTYEEIESVIHNTLDYFINNRLIFKKFSIKDSIFYFFNKDISDIDKLNIHNTFIRIDKKKSSYLDLIINMNISNDNKRINSINSCNILSTKDITCKVRLNDLFMSDIIKIFTKNTPTQKYVDNIEGVFNLEFNTSFKNYTKLIDSNFKITSNSGNFLLKDFFPNKIYYSNLVVSGASKNTNHILLNDVIAKIGTNEDSQKNIADFKMFMDIKDKEFMKLNFDISNAKVEDLNSFWPLFLEADGVRDWVVEHFKSGKIDKSFAYMDFKYINGEFVLKNIKSEVDFSDTLLNYDKDFPEISNMSAKAVFTVDDMNIYIKNGNIYNTKILDGKISTNFATPPINIFANTIGNTYEMFYFIDNNSRNDIKNIVNTYINGVAESVVNVDIPLYKDISLSSVLIDVKSNIKNNNTFLLKNDSQFNLLLKKDYDSNIFKTSINFDKSYINFSIIDFIKEKNENISLDFDIVVNNNVVELSNIHTISDLINFNGNGKIFNGNLSELNINNIKYKDNNFNFNYILLKDNIQTITINGSNINLHINNNIKQDKMNYGNIGNTNISCVFDTVVINNNFSINNLNSNINFVNNDLDNIYLFILKDNNKSFNFEIHKNNEDEDKKYNINGTIKNLGKFLSDSNITDTFIYGDLYADGYITDNNSINMSLRIKNKFGIITKDMQNIKFFNSILHSDLISQKTKDKLNQENSLMFENMHTDVHYYNDEIIRIKNFILKSDSLFGVGISGKGKFYINDGKVEFAGLVIPADKINTLFGMNKIPVLDRILFGSKNGGLFTTGYSFNRDGYDSNYEFKLIPTTASNANSIKNLLLLLLFL